MFYLHRNEKEKMLFYREKTKDLECTQAIERRFYKDNELNKFQTGGTHRMT